MEGGDRHLLATVPDMEERNEDGSHHDHCLPKVPQGPSGRYDKGYAFLSPTLSSAKLAVLPAHIAMIQRGSRQIDMYTGTPLTRYMSRRQTRRPYQLPATDTTSTSHDVLSPIAATVFHKVKGLAIASDQKGVQS